MKIYGVIEVKSTTKEKLQEVLDERLKALKLRNSGIKILNVGEPKREGYWFCSFIEFEHVIDSIENLLKFIVVETPAFIDIETESIEVDSNKLGDILTKISSTMYAMRKILNLNLVTYNEQGDSRWITPDLAEDLFLTKEAKAIIGFLCEVDVAEIDENYIKPLFNSISGFYPFDYRIIDKKQIENQWVVALKVYGAVRSISTIFYVVSTFTPSEIDILKPETLTIEPQELHDGVSVLSSVMATLKTMTELKLQTKFSIKKRDFQ